MTAKLWGVGVGPGAPDLLTLRAVNVLRGAEVLALPRSNDWSPSMAWKIAKPAVGEVPGQERLFLTFPMSKDPEKLRPAFEVAFAAIGERLLAGKTVAFATEGDPSLFSTFIYVSREIERRHPEVPIEIVPAVSSVLAVPARARVPLADGCERIAILPATYGTEDLRNVMRAFDTIVLMKIGESFADVVTAIRAEGLADRAVFVARATMPDERIERDLDRVRREDCDCFAMMVVARRERAGLLAGAVTAAREMFA
jgi:precorrin-2/cobalt-factor-2 C20-methyltransferase